MQKVKVTSRIFAAAVECGHEQLEHGVDAPVVLVPKILKNT